MTPTNIIDDMDPLWLETHPLIILSVRRVSIIII
jgi:hypothetical protein